MYKKLFLITTFVFFVSFLVPSFSFLSFAQEFNENDVMVDLIPKNPGPNEKVKINLNSYSTDINKTNIRWTVNNKLELNGIGKTSYSVTTGALGSTTSIIIEVSFSRLNVVKKTILIKPTEIDLFWESLDSYTYPFYKGRPLPSSESTINVVAIPNIKTSIGLAKASELSYTWKRNYDNMPDDSGYGKNNFVFKANYLNKSDVINVSAGTTNQNYGGVSQIELFTYKPKIVLYQNSPLYGIDFANALNNGFNPRESQTSIFAVPFFFSTLDANNQDLIYKWRINGKNIDNPNPKNLLTVKPVSKDSGIAKIDLSIESASKLFDQAIATLQLTLNNQ